MRINTIINRFILKEMFSPFIINLFFFMFVFLMARILDITNLIVNYKISVIYILLLLAYSIPDFMVFVIPMAVMMSVLLTFLKLSNDNEILALKASGVSLYRMIVPVLFFCLAGCLLTVFMTVWGMPWGRTAFKEMTVRVATSNLNAGIQERKFNDRFKGVMLYVGNVDKTDGVLRDVFIEDSRAKSSLATSIVAPEGKLFGNPDELIFQLRLFNGIINQVDLKNRSVHTISFDTYDLKLDLEGAASRRKKVSRGRKEMSLGELRRYIHQSNPEDDHYYKMLLELHRKFSIPFACLALGILAVPLGIQSQKRQASSGLVTGLIFFLLYYILLSAGLIFGETGIYPPLIGMWAPNVILGGIGIYLLVRVAGDRPIQITLFQHYKS
ncbi:MAG: LPS export ABC transporter permease LptF [Desulfobacteraceae bacterium 4572_123]|nr:MAG: LPS export ABC transporter permease LptF [Desulfobacteraceae bacterium 4572_123]